MEILPGARSPNDFPSVFALREPIQNMLSSPRPRISCIETSNVGKALCDAVGMLQTSRHVVLHQNTSHLTVPGTDQHSHAEPQPPAYTTHCVCLSPLLKAEALQAILSTFRSNLRSNKRLNAPIILAFSPKTQHTRSPLRLRCNLVWRASPTANSLS